MKLIIREYLASLREREELDAVLPDLLSQMGLNVYSRPGRGTRQDGVDVGAVGALDGGEEKVYLFTIKPGDLTRATWSGGNVQDVRPSLEGVLDAYIPNRLPNEHRGKKIVICICCGGDIREPVRPDVEGFIKKYKSEQIEFETWNGDKLAALIQDHFLRDELLPSDSRASLRKSLAMLDEPDTSYKHFATLLRSLSAAAEADESKRVTTIRQVGICLWILLAWARGAKNLEAAYLAGELSLLHAWQVYKGFVAGTTKTAKSVEDAFATIFHTYRLICAEFIAANVLPHVDKLHALSSASNPSCSQDVNLKLFDLLGRLSLEGIWLKWASQCLTDATKKEPTVTECMACASAVKSMVVNNPALLLPIKDDQSIDLSLAWSLLAYDEQNHDSMKNWMSELVDRASFAYAVHGAYPCHLQSYSDLITHPQHNDDDYRKNVTGGSVLYPLISLWSALLVDETLYEKVRAFKQKHLEHCTFQLWYPSATSEEHYYLNSANHGVVMSNVPVELSSATLLSQVFGECDQNTHFDELSVMKHAWWPILLVASRHYRLPAPIHFLKQRYQASVGDGSLVDKTEFEGL